MSRFIELLSKSRLVGLLIIWGLTLAAHGNIFHNKFVMDDFDFIVDWPLIQDWKNFSRFFVGYTPPPGQEGIYSPLKTVFHAVNYHLFGLNPLGYHIVSLLVHGLGIYFVYSICVRLTKNNLTAFVGGLLFALHPVQVEAITYMTASVDMIGIVFLFMSFFYYLKAYDGQDQFKRRTYIFSLAFAVAAVFTHELAISLPLLFFWYEICFEKIACPVYGFSSKIHRQAPRSLEGDDNFERFSAPASRYNFLRGPKARGGFAGALGRTAPFFILAAVYALAKFFILKSITRGAYLYDSFYLTMLVTVKAFAKYVYLCFVPDVLTHNQIISRGISSFDPADFDKVTVLTQSVFDPSVLLALCVLGGLIFWGVRQWKAEPLVSFCLGWFFIALLPVSNIIPSGVFFGERYLYPGLLGFCLLLGLYAEKSYRGGRAFLKISASTLSVWAVVCLAVGYGARTWERNKDWRDEVVFYESAVRANPQSALMRTDLGLIYIRNGLLDKAVESFQQALRIRPDDPVTYFSLAEAYTQMGRRLDAAEALRRAVDLKPDYGEAYYNLAGLSAVDGDMDKALGYLNKFLFYYKEQDRSEEAQELEKVFKKFFKLVK